MLRLSVVSAVVGLLVVPAVATADPIPVGAIVEQSENYGSSVRLDRGSSQPGQGLGASPTDIRRPFDQAADVAAVLAGGAYASVPEAGSTFIAAPSAGAAPSVPAVPLTSTQVAQAFPEGFGSLTAGGILLLFGSGLLALAHRQRSKKKKKYRTRRTAHS